MRPSTEASSAGTTVSLPRGGHAPARNRTWNLRIKSPLLCQLSYRGAAEEDSGEPAGSAALDLLVPLGFGGRLRRRRGGRRGRRGRRHADGLDAELVELGAQR